MDIKKIFSRSEVQDDEWRHSSIDTIRDFNTNSGFSESLKFQISNKYIPHDDKIAKQKLNETSSSFVSLMRTRYNIK